MGGWRQSVAERVASLTSLAELEAFVEAIRDPDLPDTIEPTDAEWALIAQRRIELTKKEGPP